MAVTEKNIETDITSNRYVCYKHRMNVLHQMFLPPPPSFHQGTLFHRVIPRFVCQGGDVTFGGRNKQAPLSIYERLFEDESHEMRHSEPGETQDKLRTD